MATNQQREPRTLTNRKGVSVVTLRSDKEAFEELERQVDEGKASSFALDLVFKGRKYGLSEEQFWWVHKLLVPPTTIDCSEIIRRMHAARREGVKVKNIRITLKTRNGNPVHLSMAGMRSKHFGDVWVTDGGQYPDNVLYGKIAMDGGTFSGNDVPEEVREVLESAQDNPEAWLPW